MPTTAIESSPPRRPDLSRLLRRALGGLAAASLTLLLIGTAFFRPSFEGGLSLAPRFPLDAWATDLPAHLPWVLLFALFSASMIPLRAWRWGFTLPQPVPPYADRYHSVALGHLAHNAIPGKLGDVVRALALSRFCEQRGKERLPFARSLGTILVCKVLDLFALLLLVSLSPSGPLLGNASGVRGGYAGVALVLPLLVALLILTARNARRVSAWLARRGRLPRLQLVLTELGIGVGATGPKRLLIALGCTMVAVGSVATGYTVALHGAGVETGLTAGIVVLAAVTLGQSPPGVPAGLGMYYMSCSWAARALGATPAEAATVAVLTHLTTACSHLVVGAISLGVRRLKLRDLLPRRQPGEGAVVAAPVRVPTSC